MSTAPAKVAEYAPTDDTLAGLLEHRAIVNACIVDVDGCAEVAARLHSMRSKILRTAEDLFRVSLAAQMRAQEALEHHDAEAEGAIRQVTAAAEEARDVVIKLRNDIRQSGTDPEAHPTDELVRATTALTVAKQHANGVTAELGMIRVALEREWAAAARQCVQDGVLMFGAISNRNADMDRGDSDLDEPLPNNVKSMFSIYPLPVYELHEVLHREKPREGYAAGAAS